MSPSVFSIIRESAMGVHRSDVGLFRFRHRAEPHQRAISASIRFAPHAGGGKTKMDQTVASQRERRIVERLQKRAGDHMRLALPALARPGMQRQLMLEHPLAARRKHSY